MDWIFVGQTLRCRGRHGVDIVGNNDPILLSRILQHLEVGFSVQSKVSQSFEFDGRLISPNTLKDMLVEILVG